VCTFAAGGTEARRQMSRPDPRVRGAARPRPGDESGLGLVEVMVAVLILTVALTALAQVMMSAMVSVRESRLHQQATAAANRALEEARTIPFESLAMRTGHATIPGATYDPDGAGPLAAEPVIHATTGGVVGAAFHGATNGVRVATYVSGPVAGTTAGRRVTVEASWTRARGVAGTLRLATVVTSLDRGLPAPDFEVNPLERASQGPPGARTCYAHTIRNRGFADRHTLVLPPVPGYLVRAYEDRNRDGQPDVSELLTDTTGDGHPNTPTPLQPNATRDVLVCYQPTNSANTNFTGVNVAVRSVYDGTVTRTLTHRHEVRSGITLHLHDSNNTANHYRTYPAQFPMSATPTTHATLFNYSSDRLALPGLQMEKGTTGNRAEWSYQFPTGTTLGGGVELRFWSAWKDAIDPTQNKSDPKDMSYQVTLQRVVGGTTTNLATHTITYRHQQAGWVRVDHVSTLPTTTFATNDRLVLRLECLSGSADDCHVAYDTVSHLARLYVAQP
jgi:Tfp pilus assembly protein PilV